MKFIVLLIILLTIASVVFAALQKTCKPLVSKGITIETCEPTTPLGKWVQTNMGIQF